MQNVPSRIPAFIGSFFDRHLGDTSLPLVRRGLMLFAGVIMANILIGIAAFLLGHSYPILSGLAVLAWGFGLRHAMDADHIAAIDNVTRRLLYSGGRPLGVGSYFSLGHSTVVLLLTILILFFAPSAGEHLSSWKSVGAMFGAAISSVFLVLIGTINISVLIKLIGAWRDLRLGKENAYHGHMHIGGPIEKLFRPLFKLVDKSYKMYLIGFLFGLGFDTATEVGLLAISALAVQSVPVWTILILPLSFMAGMALLDTLNSLCMLGIYSWGAIDQKERLFFNMSVTIISLFSAIAIGGTVGLRLLGEYAGFKGGVFSLAASIPLDNVGYLLAAFCIACWLVAFTWVILRTRMTQPL